MAATFDINNLLRAKVVGETSTQRLLPPEGELLFKVADTDVKKWLAWGKNDKGDMWFKFNIPLEIMDEAVLASMGRDKFTVYYDGFLEFDTTGNLSSANGQNVDLGRIRKALGMNDSNYSGDIESLFTEMRGKGPVKGTISIRQTKDDDPDSKRANIKNLSRP